MGKKPQTSWGKVASEYHGMVENSESYQSAVILPNLLRALGDIKGKKILDIGCGEGFFSREFFEKGATVLGVDVATEMIKVAREESGKKIMYEVSPSDKLPFVDDGMADVAVIVLAIQNIEKMHETFQECARVLKKGGMFVLVINHPSFRIPKHTSWLWDEELKMQSRRVDSYMSDSREKIDMDPGMKGDERKRFTYSFHRPLQGYVKALAKYGFMIDGLEEWISHKKSQNGPRGKAEDIARKEFPMFMMIRARKIDLEK